MYNIKDKFIQATRQYNTFEDPVPAFYFRKVFHSDRQISAVVRIAVCGFYELFFNGKQITKGFLSPYISNPNDLVYYDEYQVELTAGENVFGILLGNGFQNNPGGYIWDFDKADFRSAPKFSMEVKKGEDVLFFSDETFKIKPSPIRSDDYRFGESYDANYETDGWNLPGYDDAEWANALPAASPNGELRLADIDPIVKECELSPVEIINCEDGYIYDFGLSHTGICRITVRGHKGQEIALHHADSLKDGDLNLEQIWFADRWERDKHIVHKDIYICKGSETESYTPRFTYHGFRYVKVTGITKEQATKELLAFLVYHTALETRGDFACSDPVATKLQELTRRSIVSNFHHFPTDCPQREKNGWTADAALSCEAALLNFTPERNYREWLRNICKAQREDGALPGIVPTGGWGFHWGNGPAWDCVLAWIPYYTYLYRGSTEMISESAETFIKYLRYLRSRCDDKGLLAIGLGDWCHVGGLPPKAPLAVTDTITAMDIAHKMETMLDAVKMTEEADFAKKEAMAYKSAIRDSLVDQNTLLVEGNCQTSQAMALHYGVFEEREKEKAFLRLLELIHGADDHIDVGVLGGRVLFHVLSAFGHSDLAFRMITREDYPSYGNWIKRGATTLWENFLPDGVSSMNHHFWGDISAWFIKCLAGICLTERQSVVIRPSFVKSLNSVTAYHITPEGKVSVSWHREGDTILLDVEIPDGMDATASLEAGYHFTNVAEGNLLTSGRYVIKGRIEDLS